MITNKESKTGKNITHIIDIFKNTSEINCLNEETFKYFAIKKKFTIGYHEDTNEFMAYFESKTKSMLDYNINITLSNKDLEKFKLIQTYESMLDIVKKQYLRKLIQKQKKVLNILVDSKKDYLLGQIAFNDLNQYSREELASLFGKTIYNDENTNNIFPTHLDLDATIFYASNINQTHMPLYYIFYKNNSKIKKNEIQLLHVFRLITNVLMYGGLLFKEKEDMSVLLFAFIQCLNLLAKKHTKTYNKFMDLEKDNMIDYLNQINFAFSKRTNEKSDYVIFKKMLMDLRTLDGMNKNSIEFSNYLLNKFPSISIKF